MRLKERFWCSYCGGVVKAVQKYTITGDACVSMRKLEKVSGTQILNGRGKIGG